MITVRLTSQEAAAYELAGNATDDDVESAICWTLFSKGVMEPQASKSARELKPAALSAREKIREATAYEIEVSDG